MIKLEAKFRLLSYKTNNVSKAPRDELTKILGELTDYKLEKPKAFKLASISEGVDFYYTKLKPYNPPDYFCAFKGDVCVAYLGLAQVHPYPKPDYVLVDKRMKGTGLGYRMYDAAIAFFGALESDYSLSAGATQLWRKLSNKYQVNLIVNKQPIKIVGWIDSPNSMFSPSGGVYAYPLLKQKDGSVLSLWDLYNNVRATRYGDEISAIRRCYFRAIK